MNIKNIITIIIPIYNIEEKYLQKCLDSIIHQTYPNLEILLVDDGSEEWCKKCIQSLQKKDNRIQCIVQENQGVSVARNNGIKHATGEWIIFVDADDWLELDSCQKFIDTIQENPNIEILISKIFLNKEEKEQKISNFYNENKFISTQKEKEELLISILDDNKSKYNYVESVWSKLFNKEFLIQHNLFFQEDLKIGEDCLLTYQAYNKANKIYYLNEFVYHYRINENSVTNTFNKGIIEDYNKLFYQYLKLFQQTDMIYLEEEYMSFGCKQIIRFIKKYYGNPQNPKPYKELKKEFKTLVKSSPYKDFLENADLKQFSFKKRILLRFAKNNFFSLLYTIVQLKNRR